MIKALYNNKRLISNRITLFREVQRKGYKDSRYQKVIKAGEGGTVIIELKSNEGTGTLQDARNYLTELVEQVDFGTEDKSDVYDYLAEAETYSVRTN